MKVKKRQYKSKRARPLKSSKAKSKAKKGSKRRVKKMRGGMSENIIPTVEIISLTNRKMFGEKPDEKEKFLRWGGTSQGEGGVLALLGKTHKNGTIIPRTEFIYYYFDNVYYIIPYNDIPFEQNSNCSNTYIKISEEKYNKEYKTNVVIHPYDDLIKKIFNTQSSDSGTNFFNYLKTISDNESYKTSDMPKYPVELTTSLNKQNHKQIFINILTKIKAQFTEDNCNPSKLEEVLYKME